MIRRIVVCMGLAALGGCASLPETIPQLEQARAAVEQLNRDPKVGEVAPDRLRSAEMRLREAEQAYEEGGDLELIEHKAYLAERHAQIAREQIDAAGIRDEIAQSEVARREVQLEARTAEAARARKLAQDAAAETELAREERMQLEQQLRELDAKQTERGLVLTLGDVLFDTDRAALKPGAADTLERLAAFMREYPERRVLIEGHTDSRGAEQYNVALSERRANAVREALIQRGIAAERISAVGAGESYPVASNETAAGMQLNRRVEIVISDEQGRFPGPASRVGAASLPRPALR
jgi:outer membrane protein OmpA-like peptidoglycan-associated protein